MLTISKAQMDALRAARIAAFKQRTIATAIAHLPFIRAMSQDDLGARFDLVLEAAAERQFVTERSVAAMYLLYLRFSDAVFAPQLFIDCPLGDDEDKDEIEDAEPARLATYLEALKHVESLRR